MKDIIKENKRLQIEVERLISDNMELVGVIRSMRKNAREDAADLETAQHKIWRLEKQIQGQNNAANERFDEIQKVRRERDEAREESAKLREALLRVRTWGISSKNFSATDSYKMAEWVDDGCAGELPKPDGPWIYEKNGGNKMSELLTENRRLHSQIEKLTDENMNLTAVIRTLRQHLREDNAKLEAVKREVWLWKNGKYQLDCVAVEGCKSAGEELAK